MKIKGIAYSLISMFLLGFILISCSKPTKPVVIIPEEYKLEQNNQNYEIPVEKLAVITLEENATTGYTWHYLIDNEQVLGFNSEETKAASTEKNIVGAPMIHTWKFKALQPGISTLKFAYCREWEAKILETKSKMVDSGNNPRFPRLKAFAALWEASIEKKEYTITVK